MIPRLYVNHLTQNEIITLEQLHINHPKPAARRRAHTILLNNQGLPLNKIVPILRQNRQAIASTIKKWEEYGLCGLFDKKRTGRPKTLSSVQEIQVIELVHQSPRSLKAVVCEIEKKIGISVGLSIVKRLCKKAGLIWKRIRKSLRSKRNEEAFQQSKKQVAALILREKNKELDLYYFDESGFSLTPPVPYAWQKTGETIEVPSSRSKQLNVVGFVNRDCHFESFVFEGSITTSVVVACIDQFASKITKPTTLIVDNAPTHTSNEFKEQRDKWKALGLTIQPISSYSPELNIIEIVWRKIKYEWLPFSAYDSFEALRISLFDVLANIGNKFHIKFS
jgi:transposase